MKKIIWLSKNRFHKKQKEYLSSLIHPITLVDTKLADKGIENFATRDAVYAIKH